MWNKIKNKQNIRIVLAPERDYPERTISASSRVDAVTRKNVTTALLSDEAEQHLENLLKTFKSKKLIAANPEEYEGLGLMLQNAWRFELP